MFGGSTDAVVETVCQLLKARTGDDRPRILDIGPGFGLLGERLFERLVLDLSEEWGSVGEMFRKGNWRYVLDCLEPFQENLDSNPLIQVFYNSATCIDARIFFGSETIRGRGTTYAIVVFSDVLEHMDATSARSSVSAAQQLSEFVVVACPSYYERSAGWGSPWEAHVCQPTQRSFLDLDFNLTHVGADGWVAVWSRPPDSRGEPVRPVTCQ